MTSCPHLRTLRLALKPVEIEDAAFLHAMWCDADIAQLGGFQAPTDLASVIRSIEYFNTLNASGFFWKWSIKCMATEEFYGECELYPLKPQIRPWTEWGIGYSLKKEAWGHGYMTEALAAVLQHAFIETTATRIKADVGVHNHRSTRLLERLGFQFEGLQRDKGLGPQGAHDLGLWATTASRAV